MNVLAANPLISVTPGLMIWTIVCFLIALFVLKRYAFGPIQKMIDARREQIRHSLEEADNARDEARRAARRAPQADRPGAERGRADPRRGARRTGEAMEHRMREETEAERQRRHRGDAARDRRRDGARARADPQRGRRPHARGDRDRGRPHARLRPRPRAHHRGDRLARLLAPGGFRDSRRPPHLRRGALLGGEGERPPRAGSRGALRLRGRDRADAGASRGSSQPAARPVREGGHPHRSRRRRRAALQELPASRDGEGARRRSSRRSRRSSSG